MGVGVGGGTGDTDPFTLAPIEVVQSLALVLLMVLNHSTPKTGHYIATEQ